MTINATICGATHREIVLAAFVAGCHDGEDVPVYEWQKYKALVEEEDFEAVKKLSFFFALRNASIDRNAASSKA